MEYEKTGKNGDSFVDIPPDFDPKEPCIVCWGPVDPQTAICIDCGCQVGSDLTTTLWVNLL